MAKPARDPNGPTPDENLGRTDELSQVVGADDLALDDEQRAELDRRLGRLDRAGPTGAPWEAVRARMSRS